MPVVIQPRLPVMVPPRQPDRLVDPLRFLLLLHIASTIQLVARVRYGQWRAHVVAGWQMALVAPPTVLLFSFACPAVF